MSGNAIDKHVLDGLERRGIFIPAVSDRDLMTIDKKHLGLRAFIGQGRKWSRFVHKHNFPSVKWQGRTLMRMQPWYKCPSICYNIRQTPLYLENCMTGQTGYAFPGKCAFARQGEQYVAE